LHYRSDVTINDLRGNVPTRIDKLRQGNYDAIILAKAGVDRLELDLSEFECVELNPTEFVPAPAQGVLGLQIREDDAEMTELMAAMNNTAVELRISLERKILYLLDGGCQLPLGAYVTEDHHLYVAYAVKTGAASTFLDYDVTNFDGMAEKVVSDLKNASVQ
jgi:hydroxymethylbilane synthase